jgi:hypothetical protein
VDFFFGNFKAGPRDLDRSEFADVSSNQRDRRKYDRTFDVAVDALGTFGPTPVEKWIKRYTFTGVGAMSALLPRPVELMRRGEGRNGPIADIEAHL